MNVVGLVLFVFVILLLFIVFGGIGFWCIGMEFISVGGGGNGFLGGGVFDVRNWREGWRLKVLKEW